MSGGDDPQAPAPWMITPPPPPPPPPGATEESKSAAEADAPAPDAAMPAETTVVDAPAETTVFEPSTMSDPPPIGPPTGPEPPPVGRPGWTIPKLPFAAGSEVARGMAKDLAREAPWALAAAAIVVAFGMAWFSNVVSAFRHEPGLSGADRVLTFFSPGSFIWALAVVLGLALLDLGRKFEPASPRHSGLRHLLPVALLLCAATVVASALIGVLVELTNFGQGIDTTFSGIIGYAGVLALGAPSVWWAWKETAKPPS